MVEWDQDGVGGTSETRLDHEPAASPGPLPFHRACLQACSPLAPTENILQWEHAAHLTELKPLVYGHTACRVRAGHHARDAMQWALHCCSVLLLLPLLFFILTHSLPSWCLPFLLREMGRTAVILVCCDDK